MTDTLQWLLQSSCGHRGLAAGHVLHASFPAAGASSSSERSGDNVGDTVAAITTSGEAVRKKELWQWRTLRLAVESRAHRKPPFTASFCASVFSSLMSPRRAMANLMQGSLNEAGNGAAAQADAHVDAPEDGDGAPATTE